MSYQGIANLKHQWSILGEFSNQPQEQLVEWIKAKTPQSKLEQMIFFWIHGYIIKISKQPWVGTNKHWSLAKVQITVNMYGVVALAQTSFI